MGTPGTCNDTSARLFSYIILQLQTVETASCRKLLTFLTNDSSFLSKYLEDEAYTYNELQENETEKHRTFES